MIIKVGENNPALGANCVELGTCDRKEQSVIKTLHSKKSQIKHLQIQVPQEASKGRWEEPGSHQPPSLPPVGAEQC